MKLHMSGTPEEIAEFLKKLAPQPQPATMPSLYTSPGIPGVIPLVVPTPEVVPFTVPSTDPMPFTIPWDRTYGTSGGDVITGRISTTTKLLEQARQGGAGSYTIHNGMTDMPASLLPAVFRSDTAVH